MNENLCKICRITHDKNSDEISFNKHINLLPTPLGCIVVALQKFYIVN